MRQFWGAALFAAIAVLSINPPAGAQMQFVETTNATQLSWVHVPNIEACVPPPDPNFNPSICFPIAGQAGGALAGDFDRDGRVDVFLISDGSKPDTIARNNGDGTFTLQSASWGLTTLHRGVSGAVGDYNNDGWLDVYVMSFGPNGVVFGAGHHRLYRNNGDGTFTNVAAAAGVHFASPNSFDGFGAAFGDYDLDGDLDLAVAGWRNQPAPQYPNGTRLFRNNGDGTFTDVTVVAGVEAPTMAAFSPVFVDMNDDLYPELLYASDYSTSRYYRNNTDGTFTNLTPGNGTGLDQNGMGHAIADIDGDGDLDWYVTAIMETNSQSREGNRLYLNDGAHQFSELAMERGVDDGGWGWATVALDFDNDGDIDIAETNGWHQDDGIDSYIGEQCYMFENDGTAHFTDIALSCGFTHQSDGRGMLNLDYDRDGRQDLIVFTNGAYRAPAFPPTVTDGMLRVYRNVTSGPDRHWLTVHLDTTANPDLAPDGFGAHVFVKTATKELRGVIHGGSNYVSMSELSAHFGLGADTVVQSLRVRWPNGRSTFLSSVPVDQILTISAPSSFLAGDADGDGDVDFSDLNAVLAAFGTSGQEGQLGDVNNSKTVDFSDLNAVLATFGLSVP